VPGLAAGGVGGARAAAEAPAPAASVPSSACRHRQRVPAAAGRWVAVVGENYYTELSDYVVPYGIVAASGAAEVLALATQPGPIRMFPALRIQPQATTAEFDTRYPRRRRLRDRAGAAQDRRPDAGRLGRRAGEKGRDRDRRLRRRVGGRERGAAERAARRPATGTRSRT
jgi:hypothetical protein